MGVRRRWQRAHPAQRAPRLRVRSPRSAELQVMTQTVAEPATERGREAHGAGRRGMHLTLQVWRQAGPHEPGRLVRYEARDVSPDMSFLEMLDVVNEDLMTQGQ